VVVATFDVIGLRLASLGNVSATLLNSAGLRATGFEVILYCSLDGGVLRWAHEFKIPFSRRLGGPFGGLVPKPVHG
jgi:hypothetical protein